MGKMGFILSTDQHSPFLFSLFVNSHRMKWSCPKFPTCVARQSVPCWILVWLCVLLHCLWWVSKPVISISFDRLVFGLFMSIDWLRGINNCVCVCGWVCGCSVHNQSSIQLVTSDRSTFQYNLRWEPIYGLFHVRLPLILCVGHHFQILEK